MREKYTVYNGATTMLNYLSYIPLASEGAIVITIDNKPFAVMVSLADENIQDVLLLVSRFRAQMATQSIRSQSKMDGLNKMTLREINSLIKRTRREQKRYSDS
jgi:hypothetical protein